MDGNQDFIFPKNITRENNGSGNGMHPGSNLSSLEETLRELIATSNGAAKKAAAGENLLTGGPPPAKPFPDSLPANLNKVLNTQVSKIRDLSKNIFYAYILVLNIFTR